MVGYIGAPPILATLATLMFFTGISAGFTRGRTFTGFPDQFQLIGSKTLAGIPIPFLIFVAVTIIVYNVLDHITLRAARKPGNNPFLSILKGEGDRGSSFLQSNHMLKLF